MSDIPFPYEVLPLCSVYVRTENLHWYHRIGLIFSRKNTGYYFILYAYFKWIDNQIDKKDSDLSRLKDFLERQKKIIFHGKDPEAEEEILGREAYRLISVQENNFLKNAVEKVFSSFSLDLIRKEKKFLKKDDLDRRIELIGSAALELTEFCFGKPGCINESLKRKMAWLYIQTDMLLDFDEDIESGYINISLEEIEEFGIQDEDLNGERPGPLHSKQFKDWMNRKCRCQLKTAEEVFADMKYLKYSFLYFFLRKMYQQRLRKINRASALYQ